MSRIVLLGVLALLLLHSAAFAGRIALRHASEAEAQSKACVVWGPGPETNLRAEPTPDRPAWGEEWWLHADYEDTWMGNWSYANTAGALEFLNDRYPLIRLKAIQYNFIYEQPCSLSLIGHVWRDTDADGLPDWNDPGHWRADKDFCLCDFPAFADWRYDLSEPYPEFGLGEYFWIGWQVKHQSHGNYSGWNYAGDPTGQPYWSWWWDTYDWVRIFQAYRLTGDFTMEVLVEPIGVLGVVTGGGWIPGGTSGSATRRTFGFNAQSQTGPTVAQLQFTDHGNKLKVHSDTIHTLVIQPGDTTATFSGYCRVDGVSGYSFLCEVMDRGEPGQGVDRFSIEIYDPAGNLYYSAGDFLGGGNIQIHVLAGDESIWVRLDEKQGPGCRPSLSAEVHARTQLLPAGHGLCRNYPNPFGAGGTVISFNVERSTCNVSLKVFDVTGRLVRTLVNEPRETGHYSVPWDGRDDNGDPAPSGIYFYRFRAGDFTQTNRLALLK